MYNHKPEDYKCPFCAIRDGVEGDFPYSKQKDIFYKDNDIMAVVATHWWPKNKGHVVIFPKEHFENLYDIEDKILSNISLLSKKVAIALRKLYKCEGITIRQNNEEPGDQDVWHYHLHVFPRYKGDNINQIPGLRKLSDPKERIPYAEKLRHYFSWLP